MREEALSADRLARFRSRLRTESKSDKKRPWEIAELWWGRTVTGAFRVIVILAAFAIIRLFYELLFQQSVIIQPISVPSEIQQKGYTPEVIALQLRDALEQYIRQARTFAAVEQISLQTDAFDFVLPGTGLSFKAFVAQIRAFFRLESRTNISGEITNIGGKLRLRLRENGVVIHDSREAVAPENIQSLLAEATPRIFVVTDPYIEALGVSKESPEEGITHAERIIADWRSSNWNVVWAHNLRGTLLYRKHKFDDDKKAGFIGAITEFQWPTQHNQGLAAAHFNLGLAYNERGFIDEAIKEFRTAVRIDPTLSPAHLSLGDTLDLKGKNNEAACEYFDALITSHQAVLSDPNSAIAHQRLGKALQNKQKAKEALCQVGSVVGDFGNILKLPGDDDLFKYDRALEEHKQAVDLEPNDAEFAYDLGIELLDKDGKLDEAITALQKAVDTDGSQHRQSFEVRHDAFMALSRAFLRKRELKKATPFFEKAVAEVKIAVSNDSGNAVAHKMRGNDFYYMGEFKNAEAEYSQALNIDTRYLAVMIDRGHSLFAQGYFDRAADDFSGALNYQRSRAYTAIWLYMARRHSPNGADEGNRKELRNNLSELLKSKYRDHNEWPLPIIELFLGDRQPDDVLKLARSERDYGDNECEANFYIGEWHVLRGEREKATKFLRDATESCRFDFIEREGARAELNRPGQ